jgi:hypothetical protein
VVLVLVERVGACPKDAIVIIVVIIVVIIIALLVDLFLSVLVNHQRFDFDYHDIFDCLHMVHECFLVDGTTVVDDDDIINNNHTKNDNIWEWTAGTILRE